MNLFNVTELTSIQSILQQKCPAEATMNYTHIILFISNSIALLITILICCSSFQNFKKLNKLNMSLKSLFGISIISSWLTIVSSVFSVIFCMYYMALASRICVLITVCGYLLLFLSLLGTLLTRLSETFNNSIYEISATQRNSFMFLYILIFILSLWTAAATGVQLEDGSNGRRIQTVSLCVNGVLYILTATYAVYIFSKKLMKLTQSQARTMKNVLAIKNNNILSEKQQKLITSISRYVGLFTLASFTSVLSVLLIFIGYLFDNPLQYHGEWTLVIAGIDCMFNIICLYLQYSFSTKYYQTYCKYLHLCFQTIFTKHIRESIRKRYSENRRKLEIGNKNDPETNVKMHERETLKSYSEVEE